MATRSKSSQRWLKEHFSDPYVKKAQAEGLRSRMLLQVHDELVCEVVADELEVMTALLKQEMGGAYPLAVPLEVSVGSGANWDAAAH